MGLHSTSKADAKIGLNHQHYSTLLQPHFIAYRQTLIGLNIQGLFQLQGHMIPESIACRWGSSEGTSLLLSFSGVKITVLLLKGAPIFTNKQLSTQIDGTMSLVFARKPTCIWILIHKNIVPKPFFSPFLFLLNFS